MNRVRPLGIVLAGVALLVTLLANGPAQAASSPYPVPYNFLTSAALAGLDPNADAPGSNDWTCKPSAAHPRPVVLVHGLTGNKATNWQTFAPLLANNGYCVFALTYGRTPHVQAPYNQYFGGFTDMTLSGQELAAFVTKVRRATGAAKVDLLGHSEGTVISGYYAKFLAHGQVANVVSLAPIWHGTDLAGLASLSTAGAAFGLTPVILGLFQPFFASGPQLLAGSDFMKHLRSGGTTNAPGVKYTNIVTQYDELVVPYTSGIEPGATNVTLQQLCAVNYAEHFQIAADRTTAQVVLNALDPAHARPAPCQLTLPLVGGL